MILPRARLLVAAAALAAAALVAPAPARAQDLVITVPAVPTLPPGVSPPLVNAAVMGRSGFVYVEVANSRAGTTLNQLELESPFFGNISGGVAPPGWTITNLANHGNRMVITYRVATCGQAGIAAGQNGTFRVDFQPDSSTGDYYDTFKTITPSDPCGGTGHWTVGPPQIPVKALAVSGNVAHAGGPSPLSTNVSFTVGNYATSAKTIRMALPTATPTTGAVATACTPATLSLAPAASGTFTCGLTLTSATPATYYVASNASDTATPTTATGTGASVGPVRVAAATAAFTLDDLKAAPGQVVRGALQVTNWTGAPISVTPPTYAQLTLTALAQAPGALDPAPVPALAAGAIATFSYSFSVTGLSDSYYSASGAATTSAGATNVATTPEGVVSGWKTTWTPPAVIGGRTTSYDFTVSLTNGSGGPVSRIDLLNPNPAWTGMVGVSASGVTYTGTIANGLRFDSAAGLAPLATATMAFRFTAVGGTGSYPFQILVYGPGGIPIQTFTRNVSVRSTVDFDVANLTILSGSGTSAGNTLYWTNRSTATGTHDGVVIFRTPAGTAPRRPTDFVDYLATPDAQVVYADRYGSPVSSFHDPLPGAYNYRVCNHDAEFVYSNCSSGFWNGQGYLDAAVAPSGGWTHQLGVSIYRAPGLVPTRLLGIATNAPALVSLSPTTGQRSVDPTQLTNVPSANTPAAPIGDPASPVYTLFAGETDGDVSAIDLATGRLTWTWTKAGETFTAGVTGAPVSWLPAAYATEALFLGSETGRVLALDARTGATLWTIAPSATRIGALATYDHASATTYRLYVPTDGAGIFAYDLAASTRTTPPAPLAGWTNPGGAYTLGCIPRDVATLACVDASGTLRLLDKATGEVKASGASGVSSPTSLWSDAGALVVGNGARLARLTVSGTTIAVAASYAPAGVTLSKPQVFGGEGFVYVGRSDLMLQKLALATLAPVSAAPVTTAVTGTVYLAQPVFDPTTNLFLVGASDGRVWALPRF